MPTTVDVVTPVAVEDMDRPWAEFLLKLARNEWHPGPISDTSLEGVVDPRFLHDKDEAAAYEAGLDPCDY